VNGGQRRRVLASTGLGIGAALGATSTADATTFTVSNTADAGAGSLRQAVIGANASIGPDDVVFQSSVTGAIALTTGAIDISDAVAISGPGPDALTVAGNGASRLFNVDVGSDPQVTIAGLRLTGGNAAGDGGAVRNYDALLTLDNTVVSGNRTASEGGAVTAIYGGLTVTDSTITGNTAGGSGGGIYTYDPGSDEPVVIERSTISSNSASGNGGGIYLYDNQTASIVSSTVASNAAGVTGGGLFVRDPSPTVLNTLFADNVAASSPDVHNFAGSTTAASFSLIESPAGAALAPGGPNVLGQDPRLGPLADNAGETPTRALPAGSPALDKGQATGVDQRGLARPFDIRGTALATGGNGADIGAYERVLCGNVAVNLVGTTGKDRIRGTNKPDGILGFGGKDTLLGLGGRDGLCGGPGKDVLKGGGGNDSLLGQGGRDRLIGGKGKDKLKGGAGKDTQRQ
jgi:parallel beta-helix repeat protein